MRGKVVAVVAALGLLAAACAGQQAGPGGRGRPAARGQPTDGQATFDVQAEVYKYGGIPGSIPAGAATFNLENVGQGPHEFTLARIGAPSRSRS